MKLALSLLSLVRLTRAQTGEVHRFCDSGPSARSLFVLVLASSSDRIHRRGTHTDQKRDNQLATDSEWVPSLESRAWVIFSTAAIVSFR